MLLDGELDQLRAAQQSVEGGLGQLAALIGDAGMGKSRLIHEFTHPQGLPALPGWLPRHDEGTGSIEPGTGPVGREANQPTPITPFINRKEAL